MTAASPPLVNFGWRAVDFHLADTRGKVWSLDTLRGPKGLLLMFICNHCEYVLAVIGKLAKQGRELHDMGFGVAAICSNDAKAYPADSYEKMGLFARQHHLPFPYLHDATQSVARAYDAACTAAGLRLVDRWATWDREPFVPGGGYAVSAHTRPATSSSMGATIPV